MNRKQLSKVLSRNTSLTQNQAENLIIAFGSVITDALKRGDKIVYSNFGTFYTVHYPSKTIFHPKLGREKTMIMLPTDVAKWMPSSNIKAAVNKGVADIGITEHKSRSEERSIKKTVGNFIQYDRPRYKAQNTTAGFDDEPQINRFDENARHKQDNQNNYSNGESDDTYDIPVRVQRTKTATNDNATRNQANKREEYPESRPTMNAYDKQNDDNIEAYENDINQRKGADRHINIYEEILGDGSSEISTHKGSIKAYIKNNKNKPFSFIERLRGDKSSPAQTNLNKQSDDDRMGAFRQDQKDKISLADAGIFSPVGYEKGTTTANENETKINKIKSKISSFGQNNQKMAVIAEEQKPINNTLPETNSAEKKEQIKKQADDEYSHHIFDKINISYKDLSKTTVPKELLAKLPEKIAREAKAVPISEDNDKITVAMIDPEDVEAKEIIKKMLGNNIEITLATESDISHILGQYQGLESEVSEAVESAENLEKKDIKDQKKTKQEIIDEASDDAPAARIVSSLLKRAIRDKASDIHIEPTEKEVSIRFRLDGVLKKKVSLPKEIQLAVVSRIKILSNLKIDEQRLPQDGRFNMTVDSRRVDFRVSTMPIANGEKVVIRILDKETGILTIEQLGVRGSGISVLENEIKKSHGMILVTGPTGSGKTTTLYAIIDKLYSDGVNIATLEDPIEYQLKGVNQSQVNSEIGFTFANGLRSLVRQDPDIIMLGEIRDGETAEMAVHAALTGHVVLSTLHTNDAAGAMPRLIDMDVEPFLLTSSVNAIIGQRLGRKICEECKEEIILKEEEISRINAEIEKMPEKEKTEIKSKELKFYHGKGCKNCDDSGYKGRIGVYEVLTVTEEIKEMILKQVSSSQIQKKATEQGMVTMLQDGILKAVDGITSIEEVWRVTKD